MLPIEFLLYLAIGIGIVASIVKFIKKIVKQKKRKAYFTVLPQEEIRKEIERRLPELGKVEIYDIVKTGHKGKMQYVYCFTDKGIIQYYEKEKKTVFVECSSVYEIKWHFGDKNSNYQDMGGELGFILTENSNVIDVVMTFACRDGIRMMDNVARVMNVYYRNENIDSRFVWYKD